MAKYKVAVLSSEKHMHEKMKDFENDIEACEYAQELADIYDGTIFDVRVADTNRLVDHFNTY